MARGARFGSARLPAGAVRLGLSSSRAVAHRNAATTAMRPFIRPTYGLLKSTAEKKNIDSTVTFAGLNVATGTVTVLNACTAGGLPTNRVGRRICMKSVLIKGFFSMQPTSTQSCPIRMIIVYDKQTNKAAPAAADILAADAIQNPNLLANSHRFQVIRDIIIPCIGTAGPQSVYVNEYAKINLETEFIDGAGAGTVADITSGGLFALAYANGTTAAGGIGVAVIANNITTRVRFTDM